MACGAAAGPAAVESLPAATNQNLWLRREELGCGDEAGDFGAADAAAGRSSRAPATAGETIPESARGADTDADAAVTSAPAAVAATALPQEGGGGDVVDEDVSDSFETDAAHAAAAAAQDAAEAEEGNGPARSLRRR